MSIVKSIDNNLMVALVPISLLFTGGGWEGGGMRTTLNLLLDSEMIKLR